MMKKRIEMKGEGSERESEVGSKADEGEDRGKKWKKVIVKWVDVRCYLSCACELLDR